VSGSSQWTVTGSSFSFSSNAGVEYLGNAITGNTASQSDTITVADLQYVNLGSGTSGTFNENDSVNFFGSLGSGSDSTVDLTVGSQPLPVMTFSPPGGNSESFSLSISGLTEPILMDYTQTAFFGAGSLAGSQITALPTPEPGSFGLALGMVLGLVARRSFLSRRGKDC
jgi:hypothetical protein